jgi:hypothetical protein
MRYQAENLFCVGLNVRGKFNKEYNFVKMGYFVSSWKIHVNATNNYVYIESLKGMGFSGHVDHRAIYKCTLHVQMC